MMNNPTINDNRLLNDLKLYGDRTSSLMTLYPGFQSFDAKIDEVIHGQIRYADTARSWIAATEPLTTKENKAALFKIFAKEAKRMGKRSLMVPVTEKLSACLTDMGYHRIQIGSEPIISLRDYFKKEPLDLFPHARSLLKRGFIVEELDLTCASEQTKSQLQTLTQTWIENRSTVPLRFLNQVEPLKFSELKKFFVVRSGEKILAFLSAAPVATKNSYFYADYIRDPQSRAGTVELLFIESMRLLYQQGISEVRLGLCPFAQIDVASAGNFKEKCTLAMMNSAFLRATFPLNFKSIYQFKSKFKPTRWEPLYLVSSKSIGIQTASDLARVHFPDGIGNALRFTLKQKTTPYLKLSARNFTLPKSITEFVKQTPLTHGLVTLFLLLHALRVTFPFFHTVYLNQGFSAGNFSWSGLFLGPLFHNHAYHLLGDISTFWIFGSLLEIILGSRIFFMITAFGLWATNPLTWWVVETGIKILAAHMPSEAYSTFLKEIDYGSSNAVYASVGALAALLIQPRALLLPFIANGVFLCVAKQSLLSLHHLIALAGGYFIALLLVTELKPEADSHVPARF